MCDTVVAVGNATADGAVIFAKNSDREPNEAHQVVCFPRARHPEGSMVRCTYLDIPQVPETNAVLLAKPFWIWGAEMGANEHGVTIGNEAVFTRVPYEKGPGLIGMDFIRLALERASTAREALDVMTGLLEEYGQGGNCGFTHKFFYHNSFILADSREAWVLETAGKQWAAEKVRDVRSISNAITIGREWDLASGGLVDEALARGWCKRREDFNFARCYSDPIYTRLSAAKERQCRSTELLKTRLGKITITDMMALLRDHGPEADSEWHPGRGITGADVCMHAGFGPVRGNQSVGSLVSHLSENLQTHWVTTTSAPCTGIFKPVWLDTALPETGIAPTGTYSEASLWWRHEALHRAVLRDYAARLACYREERDSLEDRFVSEARASAGKTNSERASFSAQCFEEAGAALERWRERVESLPVSHRSPPLYSLAWRGFERRAAIPSKVETGWNN